MQSWNVRILTLFPEIFPGPLSYSITGKALKDGVCTIETKNIRDYATDKHKTVDDTTFGGGNGMVLKPDVLANAIEDFFMPNGNPIYYLSPRGKQFNQYVAEELVGHNGINIICGRFEGIDERVFLEYKIQELSLGDFVLTAGDIAAIPILDCCIRLLPSVLNDTDALKEESFATQGEYKNLLEYPQYTKPAVWRGHEVPEVLRSGNHAEINKWRYNEAIKKTKDVRPDLLDQCTKEGK